MTQVLSTDSVARRERPAYWIDAICDAYVQLECEPLADGGGIDGENPRGAERSLARTVRRLRRSGPPHRHGKGGAHCVDEFPGRFSPAHLCHCAWYRLLGNA